MAKPYHQIIMLILAAVLVAACAATPTSPPPTSVPPTVTAPTAVPTNRLPTVVPSFMPTAEASPERTENMKIRITLEDRVITATLYDNNTSRDFISLLPLTLTLEDYEVTEKISYLPKRLSTEDAPAGIDPSIGDITYYAPWENMAIFIRDFGYSSGLVLLGKIDGDMAALNVSGPISVTIELIP